MERPEDCPDPSGNGGGCDSLHRQAYEHNMLRKRVDSQGVSIATLRVNVEGFSDAISRIESKVDSAAADSAAVRKLICAPINDIIAKYKSEPPPDLLDADDGEDIATDLAIQVPWMGARKIRREQQRAREAEKRAEELGAERERVKLAAKLETERLEREKRNARLIASALATIGMIATALGTYFATHTAQPSPPPQPVHHEVTR